MVNSCVMIPPIARQVVLCTNWKVPIDEFIRRYDKDIVEKGVNEEQLGSDLAGISQQWLWVRISC